MLLLFYRRWAVVVLLLKWVFELQHCISYGAASFTRLCKYLNGQKDLIDNIDNCMRESEKFYLTFNHARFVRLRKFERATIMQLWLQQNFSAVVWCTCGVSHNLVSACRKISANGKGFHRRMVQWFIYLDWNIWHCTEKVGSMLVSEHLRTYPSPNPTLTLICRQLAVLWFGGGRGKGAVAKILTLIENAFSLDLRSFWDRP